MVISNQLLKLTQCIVMLNMQFPTSHNQVLILVLLFAAVVQTRRVIRAAPGIKTTGSRSRVINSESLFVSGSGMHSKYLKFLDICSYASIFRYANDYTRAVQLPSTFNIRRRTYHTLYISPNGLLSFGTPFTSSSATSFPIPFAVVIAPFWDDIKLTNTGIVEYGIFTSSSTSSVINEVERFLKLNQSVDLNLDWVFVAKWDNVCPSINSNCDQTNTFQVVVASQGSTSYAIFTYKCDHLRWTRHNAAIGYSAGQYNFANHAFSRTSKVTDIDCLNYPSSVWSNVVYNLNPEFIFGSGMDSNYLTFQDLGLHAKMFKNVTYGSRAVGLPSPLNVGGQTFHTLYISSNGLLSLGKSFTSYSPATFPLSSAVVIAPFWDDIQLTNTGIVEYGIINSSNTSSIINEVEEFLKLNQYLELELDWVMVAKWVNVCPYGNTNCNQTNTFQVVIASEGSTSYAIFIYKCDLLQWTRYNAAIGYSAGLNNFANHPLSRTERVINIDCLNYPSSVWSNVVYNLSEVAPTPPVPEGSCLALNLNYSGCCVPSLSQTCWNYGCYCDQICHTVGDCCSDVADIGCHPPTIGTGSGSGAGSGINETISVTPQLSTSIDTSSIIVTPTQTIDITVTPSPTPPTIQGSCLALNLTYCGCCKQSLSSQCYDNGCYCDESCHEYNDCCSDIADIDCYSNCYTDTEPITIINEDN